MESTAAFVVGGGLALLILGYLLASAQSGVSGFDASRLNIVMIVGAFLFVGGIALWLATAQPWKNFDDWSTPLYTGHHDEHAPASHAEAAHQSGAQADSLEIIEGIGPKIAAALRNAGIATFADLASRQPAEVERIVRDAGVRMVGHADTWIEQARLAVEGKMTELEAYQHNLRSKH
jgi:hypothetical protein